MDVRATVCTGTSPAAGPTPEKAIEDVVDAEPKRIETAPEVRIHASLAEPIVGPALLGITKHLIGFVDLFELLVRLVGLIAVRVIVQGQLPEGFADIVRRCRAGDAQDFVIVALDGCHCSL